MRYLRGRALNVPLASGKEEAVSQLERRGFPELRAQAVANAATQFADEETQYLERQLNPRATWPGLVICRRSVVGAQDTVWLTLRYEQKAGWMLDSALFE